MNYECLPLQKNCEPSLLVNVRVMCMGVTCIFPAIPTTGITYIWATKNRILILSQYILILSHITNLLKKILIIFFLSLGKIYELPYIKTQQVILLHINKLQHEKMLSNKMLYMYI